MQVLKYLAIVTSMMTLCLEQAASESVLTESHPIRHSLPPNRLVPIYGSCVNGSCDSIIGLGNICNGTSVLNDGIIPTLYGVSSNSQSQWAINLFTMRRPGVAGNIIVSLEVEPVGYSCMKLAVFNCPELGISTPIVNVYSSDTFRPEDVYKVLGNLTATYTSTESSCNHLTTYTIEFYQKISQSYFNLEFHPVHGSNSSYVFLGEVTFLTEFEVTENAATSTSSSGQERKIIPTCQIRVAIASTAALAAAITAGLSAVIHFTAYKCVYKVKTKFQEQMAGINPSEKSDMDETDDYEPVQEYAQ